MPKMAYFRRSSLAGKVLRPPTNPALRGNVRRKNPSNDFAAAPYFSGLPVGGGTFLVRSKYDLALPAGQVSVTVPADPSGNASMESVLAALNHATTGLVPIKVLAYDTGGCIGLMSTSTTPSDSWLEVQGGTAAVALGFDTLLQRFYAGAGDLTSAPEAKLGNPYGSVLPTPGENFDSASITRALARIMSNMDVLFSEQSREEPSMLLFGPVSGPRSFIDIDAIPGATGKKVFTGGTPLSTKVLDAASSQEDLARFFYFMDPVTRQMAKTAVVGVTDTSDANILGVERQLATGPINAIPNGEIIKVGFNTGQTKPGDYVEIAGATNGLWRNNGYRWVVDEVPDTASLKLRPMSRMELLGVGAAVEEEQPIVELSSVLNAGESFGTATVFRGPYSTGARLQLSPPIPADATYELYACTPASKRDRLPTSVQESMKASMAHAVRMVGEQGDAVLVAPTTINGAVNAVVVSDFLFRWRGRVIRQPATIVTAGFTGPGTLYIDTADATIKTSPANAAPTFALILATFTSSGVVGSNSVTAYPARRTEALDKEALSVGAQCQFPTIKEALNYVSAAQSRGGTQKSFEIVLFDDVDWTIFDGPINGLPNVHIRGASEAVKLTSVPTLPNYFNAPGNGPFTISDLTVQIQGTQKVVSGTSNGTNYYHLSNVIEQTPAGNFRFLHDDGIWFVRSALNSATRDLLIGPTLGGTPDATMNYSLYLPALHVTTTIRADSSITGANISSDSSISAGTDVYAARDVTAARNLTVGFTALIGGIVYANGGVVTNTRYGIAGSGAGTFYGVNVDNGSGVVGALRTDGGARFTNSILTTSGYIAMWDGSAAIYGGINATAGSTLMGSFNAGIVQLVRAGTAFLQLSSDGHLDMAVTRRKLRNLADPADWSYDAAHAYWTQNKISAAIAAIPAVTTTDPVWAQRAIGLPALTYRGEQLDVIPGETLWNISGSGTQIELCNKYFYWGSDQYFNPRTTNIFGFSLVDCNWNSSISAIVQIYDYNGFWVASCSLGWSRPVGSGGRVAALVDWQVADIYHSVPAMGSHAPNIYRIHAYLYCGYGDGYLSTQTGGWNGDGVYVNGAPWMLGG